MAFNAPQRYTNQAFADSSINFYLAPGDVLVQCPYYPHKILEAKLSRHLTKCRAQYIKEMDRNSKLPKMLICKDNWCHHVKESEYDHHVQFECNDARERLSREAKEKAAEEEMQQGNEKVDEELERKNISVDNACGSYANSIVSSHSAAESSMFTDSVAYMGSAASDVTVPCSEMSSLVDFDTYLADADETSSTTRTKPWGTNENTEEEDDWGRKAGRGRRHAPARGYAHRSTPTYYARTEKVPEDLYYIPPGMSKSERIAFRQKMIARARELEEQELSSSTSSICATVGSSVKLEPTDVEGEDDFAHIVVEPTQGRAAPKSRKYNYEEDPTVLGSAYAFSHSASSYGYDNQDPSYYARTEKVPDAFSYIPPGISRAKQKMVSRAQELEAQDVPTPTSSISAAAGSSLKLEPKDVEGEDDFAHIVGEPTQGRAAPKPGKNSRGYEEDPLVLGGASAFVHSVCSYDYDIQGPPHQ